MFDAVCLLYICNLHPYLHHPQMVICFETTNMEKEEENVEQESGHWTRRIIDKWGTTSAAEK